MKNTTILFVLMFCSSFIKAQDTIIKISGDTIIAKISEINPQEIKYKRFNFQDGPAYIELKENIKLVIYSNGVKETFKDTKPKQVVIANNDYYTGGTTTPVNNKIEAWGTKFRYQNSYLSERDIQEILLNTKDRKIIGLVGQAKDAKNLQFIGFAGIPLGITSVGYFWKSMGLFNNSTSSTYGPAFNQQDLAIAALCGVAAIACPVVAIVSKGNRNKYNRQAIKVYNEKF